MIEWLRRHSTDPFIASIPFIPGQCRLMNPAICASVGCKQRCVAWA